MEIDLRVNRHLTGRWRYWGETRWAVPLTERERGVGGEDRVDEAELKDL